MRRPSPPRRSPPSPRLLTACAGLAALLATASPAPAGAPGAGAAGGPPPDAEPQQDGLAAPSPVDLGDAAWHLRAEGHQGARAAAAPIARAVALYRQALDGDPGALEPSWKLLRALYFQGELATGAGDDEKDGKKAIFAAGRDGCVAAVDRLAAEVPEFAGVGDRTAAELRRDFHDRPQVAHLFFWCSVHWGLWGEAHGKLQAVRQGVAGKVRDYAAAAAALDPAAEDAGGHRVLGRLHAEAPRVPFFTGWISRTTAISELRKAAAIAPQEPLNRLYLAEALLDFGPASEHPRARTEIEKLGSLEPRPTHPVEDLYARAQARERLAREASR